MISVPGASGRRPFRRKLLYSLALFLVLFVLGELGLRGLQLVRHGEWSVPQWLQAGDPPTTVWHPFLRRVPRPGTTWDVTEGEEQARVEINSLGFRSPEISETKPAGTFRVACVGGSVVYDTRVALLESWPMQLQDRLREWFPEYSIEVVNAGIPARTSADSVANIVYRVLPLEPDVVVVLHGVNDQKPNRYPGFRPDYSHWYRREESPGWFTRAMDHSLMACHLRFRLTRLFNSNLRDNYRGEPQRRYDTVSEPGLMAYERNLMSMLGVLRIHGVKMVLATAGHSLDGNVDWQPSSGVRNPLVYYQDCLTLAGIRHAFQEYNRITRDVAGRHGCVLVDIDRLLPEGKDNYQDEVHYTAGGAAHVARIFLTEVPWRKWLEEAAGRR